MNRNYALVAERADHRCEYCLAPEQAFNLHFEVEHIIPKSRGGADEELNLALACTSCNIFKSDAVSGFDVLTGAEAKLFHPRQHDWKEHFRADHESGQIEGLTAIGRVTVNLLRINSAEQLRSRKLWIRLGIFP